MCLILKSNYKTKSSKLGACAGQVIECEGADLYMVDLQHGEKLVETRTQNRDGGGLDHQAANWRRAPTVESSEQGVISSIGGLVYWKSQFSLTVISFKILYCHTI